MTEAARDPFADIESDLDGKASRIPSADAEDHLDHSAQYSERTLKSSTQQRVEVKCESCRGTGTFYSWNGRAVGPCFKCKGAGKILRAPGYEIAKAKREASKTKKLLAEVAAISASMADLEARFPAEIASLRAYKSRTDCREQTRYQNDFMDSLYRQFSTKGTLSEGQIAALTRGVEKQKARDAERAAPATESFPRIEKLVREHNLSLDLGCCKVVEFQSGAVAVVAIEFGEGTFGIIERGGGLRRFGGMTEERMAVLRDVEANGLEAVKRIGQATGRCCVCSRKLTDEKSIADGIGPICAGRMGQFTATEEVPS